MNSSEFKKTVILSLDSDLGGLVKANLATAMEAIALQNLRIMHGKPFNVDLQPANEGFWSPDGKVWLPKAPGT